MSEQLPPVAALVIMEVEDFDKWKTEFDKHQATRVSAGALGHHIQRGADNPNLVSLYLPATDQAKALAFLTGEEIRRNMRAAGVKGTPSIKLMKPVGGDPILDRPAAGMIIVHKVASYAKWRVVYDELGAHRKETGITGDAINQLVDDPNLLVVYHQAHSVETLKKLAASTELKTAMQNAGVIGQPEITFWSARPASMY